ncbi:hypothetical protein, partial [Staphylococcus saprophyticus]|uniref:hypothetical protein n=1 Tax=Staphylococcus saprophyticus TaxID=29385 RepID=UPI0028983B7B
GHASEFSLPWVTASQGDKAKALQQRPARHAIRRQAKAKRDQGADDGRRDQANERERCPEDECPETLFVNRAIEVLEHGAIFRGLG